jgi:hypothetical protein
MNDQPTSWKVAILGPAGTVYADANAFKLLYPFPTREEAEAHAEGFRIVMKVALCDERGNLLRQSRRR